MQNCTIKTTGLTGKMGLEALYSYLMRDTCLLKRGKRVLLHIKWLKTHTAVNMALYLEKQTTPEVCCGSGGRKDVEGGL